MGTVVFTSPRTLRVLGLQKLLFPFIFHGNVSLMSGSCHIDKASNVKIGVDCQIFFIVVSFNCSQVLQFQFRVYSRYYKDALTQKRSFLVTCTCLVSRSNFMSVKKNQNKHSTLNLSFDTLSK